MDDNPKLSLYTDTLIRICVIVALILAAATKQQYSYYIFIRWLTFFTSLYFCYKAYISKQFGLLLLYFIIALLFNPLKKIWFQKATWHLIDFVVAGILVLLVIYEILMFPGKKNH